MSSSRLRESKGKESSFGLDKVFFGGLYSNVLGLLLLVTCTIEDILDSENPGMRFWGCATYDSNRKAACRFFKWMDKPICERGLKVIPTLLDRVKELENENCQYLAMVKDLEIERDGYIARVNQLEKGDD